MANQIWSLAPFSSRLNTGSISSTREGISMVNKLICLPPSGIGEGPLSPWILWSIWTTRNQLLFSKKVIPATEAMTIGIVRAREWQASQRSIPIKSSPPRVPTQTLVDDLTLRIYSDAAWKEDGKAGLGWIVKTQQDHVVLAGSLAVSHVRSPLVAEALATLAAVKVAIESAFTNVYFASDSLNLVKAINSELPHKELHGILHDILSLSSIFAFCSFNFTPRNLNRQADALAKEVLGACNEP
ncbi:uncharacterized protein LOC110228449 [Arabidopsis lyrata subsp. lyrata]|uniref:uncharacterized protein LOC110228449 n=1 Tax=Arabidopsis lyrata subsp. lyrata TaxID=81972 RepID=UPI000A29DBC0|nr:uncharacterized protein LOC110228449 [Arabidopsis lyrata subsp. lyrata]|eukprot:XP_020881689.1 uncharacterized protein LOC110228449 [Arabidopsis lyrata subsp. lyrata]